MSDVNSISSNSNELPADGHGYIPTRQKKESDSGNEKPPHPLSHEDVVENLNVINQIRDLSHSINILQEKLIDADEEAKPHFIQQINECQITIENICSVNSEMGSPEQSLDQITQIFKDHEFQPSSLAVKRLLTDE